MSNAIDQAKARLRQTVRERLQALTQSQRAEASRQICARLRAQAFWQTAGSILLFAPLPTEPDIWPLLLEAMAAGKPVALPRYAPQTGGYRPAQVQHLPQDLVRGPLGIREPAAGCPEMPLNRLDLVLVPGLAFDLHGHRLGRGKGHYDRLLAGVGAMTCGVAFEEQLVPSIEACSHDVAVRALITPTRVLWFAAENKTPVGDAGGR